MGVAGGAVLIIQPHTSLVEQYYFSSGQEQEGWPGAKCYCIIMYNLKCE